ncbi:MAG: DUF885 domain-containing protein [Betaproteobacteria bacterium]|nr:DUF885 domain-containing protein [Betaproteobacteria bacterium]
MGHLRGRPPLRRPAARCVARERSRRLRAAASTAAGSAGPASRDAGDQGPRLAGHLHPRLAGRPDLRAAVGLPPAEPGRHRRFPHRVLQPAARQPHPQQDAGRTGAGPAGGLPRRVDQEIARLQQGLLLGWVAPQPVIERVLVTLDLQIAETGDKSPFFEPFTRLDVGIGAADRAALQAQARTLIGTQVLPAQKRLRDFVAGPYAAAAPPAGGLGRYPGGAAVYAALVRSTTTTTDLTPAQIHAIGLREVARLRGEIAQVMRDANWAGDFASFAKHLNTDPSYFHTSGEALLAGYRDIGKRLDAELPKLFAELPRAPWGVRPMPLHMGRDAVEYYDSPPLDGSGPGWFNANVVGFKDGPIWAMESLTAHEAVPGHHLQNARAIELGDLPRFRRSNGYQAYSEGWALYAETLGADLGLYRDAPSRFGFLQNQIWRAARLVVDTGLHDQGWSRQRAIDYLFDTAGIDVGKVSSEVDRYTSWPGQALGYMIGQLKIIELRDRARAALGDRFDIRRFHMVVLDQGAVPLGVLESQVDGWIAAERARR